MSTLQGIVQAAVASYDASPEIVKLLLEKGADVNAIGGEYENALQAALYHGNTAIVNLLLEKGANLIAATRKVISN